MLRQLGETGTLILSIAAGVPIPVLSQLCDGANRIVRAMPNTPGAIGKGITALYAPPALSQADKDLASTLVAGLGESFFLADEALMDAVTAVSGSGPAYVFLLVEALAQAGIAQGLDAETANKLARATIMGIGRFAGGRSAFAGNAAPGSHQPGRHHRSRVEGADGCARPRRIDATRRWPPATERGKELGR